MPPLRAVFCTDTYPPQVNGVSVVTALSVHGLIERGWECSVVAPRYPISTPNPFTLPDRDDSIPRTTLPSWPLPMYPDIRLSLPIVQRVNRAVHTWKPDIVYAQTEFIIGRLGARAARQRGIPVVTSYHTDFGKYADAYSMGVLRDPINRSLTRFHQRAARTFTPSEPSADELRRMGVDHVEVWGRGVDVDIFSPRRRSQGLRASFDVGEKDILLLHVGRLAAEKGVDRILEAFRRATARNPGARVKLVIAGLGPKEDELRASAPEHCLFLGHLGRTTKLPTLYASADAFLFASTTETLGLVVLEAMASGLPVIAAPAGGVIDNLEHNVNGIAYNPESVDEFADAIGRVMTDEVTRARLAKGARVTAERRSWHQELDRLDASYREVIEVAAR